MSTDLLTSNRPSSISDSQYSNNSNQSNHCNDALIGEHFSSSILLADLAIQSTAYIPPSSSSSSKPSTDEKKKTKRRVTFKDDIQIQFIPAYSSSSSASSSSEDLHAIEEPAAVTPSSERISVRVSYDALQYRQQIRRRENIPSSRLGFWYPLNPSTINNSTSQLLPELRSLEVTERLISESIERQMALYPNLRQHEASPVEPILISSSEEEEEEDSYQARLEIAELERTPSLEESTGDAMQHSVNTSDDTSRSSQENISFEEHPSLELTLPFEKEFISISTKSSTIPHHYHLFFIKVLKAEHLDFPIENDNTNIYCSIQYKDNSSKSSNQPLAHTMDINHEMRIIDIDPDQKIAITLHVERGKKSNLSNWYHRMKPSSDLERYVHERDGSLCQTLFSPHRFMTDVDQTASLMLVNSWYRVHPSTTFSFKKKKPTAPSAHARQKAVGKIIVQCLYVEAYGDQLPDTMDEAIEGIHAHRFHQTVWQSGYLFECKPNEKESIKRYFTLKGDVLCAFSDPSSDHDRVLLHHVPLSRVMKLTCNTFIVAERHQTVKTPTTLLNQLEHVIMSKEDANSALHEENGFQLYLENGDMIQYNCTSLEERNRWLSIMEVMMCKLPILPDWVQYTKSF